jgi:hypothetical protein
MRRTRDDRHRTKNVRRDARPAANAFFADSFTYAVEPPGAARS